MVAIIGGSDITIDPALKDKPDPNPLDNVCTRCLTTTFSPVIWAHLRGDTLDSPIPDQEMFDYHLEQGLDFVVQLDCPRSYPKKRGPVVDFKISAREITQSQDEGCGFCSMVTSLGRNNTLLSDGDAKLDLSLQAFWPEKVRGLQLPIILKVGLHRDIADEDGKSMLVSLTDEHDLQLRLLDAVEPAAFLDDANPMLEEAKIWLEECMRTHKTCAHTLNSKMPSRVLKLDRITENDKVYLAQSDETPSGQYAVLSYVWGKSNNVRLLRDNQSKAKAGVPVEALPATVRHAILVALTLNIRYLWIDSLCILQDDPVDMDKEIPRMNEYYRNAALVISASGAADVNTGFLRQETSIERIHAKLHQPRKGHPPIRIPCHFQDYSTTLLVDPAPSFYTYGAEPLNTRAWTLQESVLPRRLLTFPTSGGLSMRCLHGEALAGEIISNPFSETPLFGNLGTISSQRLTGEEILQLWCELARDYTARSLTHADDSLIAIGALAREFSDQHGALLGSYVAGLWSNFLRNGLLWSSSIGESPQISRRRPMKKDTYYAPSWSWASNTYAVAFLDQPEMFLPDGGSHAGNEDKWKELFIPHWICEVVSYDVKTKSTLDSFGALKAATLEIRGPLLPLTWQTTGQSRGESRTRVKGSRQPKSGLLSKLKGKLKSTKPSSAQSALFIDKGTLGEPEQFFPDSQAGLTSTKTPPYYWLGIWFAGRFRCRGLIVEKIKDREFRRVGFAQYKIGKEEFPEPEVHKLGVVRLV